MLIERESILLGGCYELCGVNHGLMPVVGVSIDKILYEAKKVSAIDINKLKDTINKVLVDAVNQLEDEVCEREVNLIAITALNEFV